MTNFDFDPTDSNLRVGIEVEYPKVGDGEYMVTRGNGTSSLQSQMPPLPNSMDARREYDGTVGLEIVSGVLHLEDAKNWYADVLDYVGGEHGVYYQPSGLMNNGSTAGMHLHLSELSREKAEDLYEISRTPWAKVLFCSSVAMSDDSAVLPVFRGGQYCQMNLGREHYDCVNNRGSGRYEWRLPEPVTVEHWEILAKFLTIFENSTEKAIEYAQEVLDDGDDRITSIQRAEAIGMDLDDAGRVMNEQYGGDPENFYEEVSSSWAAPEIYHVEYDDEHFYTFETNLDVDEFAISNVEFNPNEIFWAESLDPVQDDEYAEEVQRVAERVRRNNTRETEATDELKKIVKKKQ